MSVIGGLVRLRRDHDCYEDLSGTDGASTTEERPASAAATRGDATCQLGKARGSSTHGSYVSFSEDTYTVDQAIDAIGFGKFQMKLSFFTGLVWMADAMEMMILSILAPALHCYWNLTAVQQALLTTVVFAGMMLSSSLWGKMCDKYGRKTAMITCAGFTFYYGLLSAFSPNYIWILLLRGLVGFGIGGVPQSVTLYAEFLPSKARAKCVVLIETFWAIGASFIVFVSIFIMPTLGWRLLLIVAAIPLLIFFLACFGAVYVKLSV